MSEINLKTIDNQPISVKTKQNYKSKLEYMEKTLEKPIDWLMTHPKAGLKLLKGQISEMPATLVSYITPLCKLYTIHPKFMDEHQPSYLLWRSYLNHYNMKRMEQYETSQMTENQLTNAVSYDDMKKKFCELEKNPMTMIDHRLHMHYLLLAMFLSIKPKRADLGEVYISQDGKIPKSHADKNYIIIRTTDTQGVLVINDYKTSKIYGTLQEPLTQEVTTIIRKSLEFKPRNYLFISFHGKLSGMPYSKKNSYSQFVRRVFEKHFGKTMGVSLWRHVYIGEHIDFNGPSYAELKNNARLSGHSIDTQMKIYRPRAGQLKPRSGEKDKLECSKVVSF